MKDKNLLTKILLIIGVILLGVPLLMPIIFGFITLAHDGVFNFDYLMPAELFPAILIGTGLVLWASIRMRSRVRLIAWLCGAVVVTLAALMLVPVITGLNNSIEGPSGTLLVILQVIVGLYWLAVILLAVSGKTLLWDLFKKKE